MKTNSRRAFLNNLTALASLPLLQNSLSESIGKFPISCNAYNWYTFYSREGKNWGENWHECIAEFAKTGLKAFEPSLTSVEEANKIWTALKAHGISMPSVYVNSVLHKKEEAEKSIKDILAIADTIKHFGVKIMVTNPTPIKWGGNELKTDAELNLQANSLEKLGAELKKRGITLAYHTHDVELRAGAREFHHMLQNTSAESMSFCMDVHWVYRGSMDSQIAVFDVLKMYGKRIVELHLRQSENGIWSETFGNGDIDYIRIAKELKRIKVYPHLVIEQCVEDKTPKTKSAIEAHIADLKEVKKIFV
jgi:inosose dehydratase